MTWFNSIKFSFHPPEHVFYISRYLGFSEVPKKEVGKDDKGKHGPFGFTSLSQYTTLCSAKVPSVVSNSLRPHGRQSIRLHCSWDSPIDHLGFEQLEKISTSVSLVSKGSTAKKLSLVLELPLWTYLSVSCCREGWHVSLHSESKALGEGPQVLNPICCEFLRP